MGQRIPPTAPRLALNKTEAAEALGVSVDFFDEHVAHEIPCVRRGRRRLYPLAALTRWLDDQAERVVHGLWVVPLTVLAARAHEFIPGFLS